MLLMGLAWNNAWKWVPEPHAGRVFTAGSGLFIAALLLWHAAASRSRAMAFVCVLLGGFALQVFGCNAWFIVEPWPVRADDELCSARLGFPLGLAGLWASTLLAQWIYLRSKHG